MSSISKAKEEPKEQLWDQIDSLHVVMLGSPDPAEHMQPMSPQLAREEEAIWFYARKDSDIARASNGGGKVHLCVMSKDQDYQACLHGTLEEVYSPQHIERFWSSMTEAWFPGGKSDPALTMLRFKPHNAAIWASTNSVLRLGWEVAKANLTGEEPDVGYRTEISFAA